MLILCFKGHINRAGDIAQLVNANKRLKSSMLRAHIMPAAMAYACNPSTGERETGRSLGFAASFVYLVSSRSRRHKEENTQGMTHEHPCTFVLWSKKSKDRQISSSCLVCCCCCCLVCLLVDFVFRVVLPQTLWFDVALSEGFSLFWVSGICFSDCKLHHALLNVQRLPLW